VTEGGETDFI